MTSNATDGIFVLYFLHLTGLRFNHVRELRPSKAGAFTGNTLKIEGGELLVTGGDILSSFLSQAGVGLVRPLGQPVPGIVGFELGLSGQSLVIFSKSGGFGNRELFVEMAGGPREAVKECAHA